MKHTQNAQHTLSIRLQVLEVIKQKGVLVLSRENNRGNVAELLYSEFISSLVNFAIENAVLKVQGN
jgi:pyruvate/2-oxoacid:ferredoxin oxidoreductase alpha subunit